ncbi:MAG: UbiA family prenyltransferase [Thermoplasmatales archaeon]|nr:UbiA family prenyltransferase [Thermoplasmatales archaeon]
MSDKSSVMIHPFAFLSQWRSLPSFEFISYVFMFASMPMLAYGVRPYDSTIITIILLSILSLYSGFFAALIWNDITDADIDSIAHPDRPIPSGKISSKKFFAVALVFSTMTFIFSFLVSFWCFILVGATALFVTFHDKYLKKIVKLPAYSEIFTPVQWIIVPIFGFLALWTLFPTAGDITLSFPLFDQSFFGDISFNSYDFQNMILLVLFTYFADNAHDLPEGIHDVEGDRKLGVKTYATSFGEKNAARISFAMFFISGILGFLLFYRTILTVVFLIPFLGIWLYTLYYSYRLLKADGKEMKPLGAIVGRKGFNYFLITYNLIFLDVFVQLIRFHFY